MKTTPLTVPVTICPDLDFMVILSVIMVFILSRLKYIGFRNFGNPRSMRSVDAEGLEFAGFRSAIQMAAPHKLGHKGHSNLAVDSTLICAVPC
jgi:hypothetical protein